MKEKPQTLSVKSIKKNLSLNTNLRAGDRVIVAISGGPDSVALLHILAHLDLQFHLTGVYIDHQLRPEETPQEIELVSTLCEKLKIAFMLRNVDVKKYMSRKGYSMEQAARFLRHHALEEIRITNNAQYVAFGHTADDQVEEFFIRLFKGSGKKGLAGMLMQEGKRIRPLLFHKKDTILQYLHNQNLPFCKDSSNYDRAILRNRIRLDLLPYLEETYNPSLRHTLLNTMEILAEEDHFLQQEAEAAYLSCLIYKNDLAKTIQPEVIELQLRAFSTFHLALQRRIIEKCCWSMKAKPSYAQISALIEMVKNSQPSSELHFKGGLRVEKTQTVLRFSTPLPKGVTRGSLHVEHIDLPIPKPGKYWVEGRKQYLVLQKSTTSTFPKAQNDTLELDYTQVSFPLQLRSVIPGDRFYPCNGAGSKKVSRYFNDKKISPKKRPHIPVLVGEKHVVAIPGMELAHPCRVTSKTLEVLKIWWEDKEKK